MSTTYPSDLTDTEWECMQRFLYESHRNCRTRRHSLRTIFNAIFYVLHAGCPWRYLPSNFPPWQTVFYHFRQFSRKGTWALLLRALHQAERCRVGKDPHPSAAIMDAQSVKTVEESAHISGFDGHKRVKGRKRHLLVDTLGIPISYYVTPANMHDTQGARRLLAGLKYFVPRLKTIWADQAYRGQELARDGAKHRVDGKSKWLRAHPALANQASKGRDGLSNARSAGSREIAERLRAQSADKRNLDRGRSDSVAGGSLGEIATAALNKLQRWARIRKLSQSTHGVIRPCKRMATRPRAASQGFTRGGCPCLVLCQLAR